MTDLEPNTRSTTEHPRAPARGRSPVDARPDHTLLAATIAGDAAAFGEFYVRHGTRLFAYFRARGASTQDAYDLVSETFATAFQSIAGFDSERGEPGAWLFGIAKNMHRHYARRGAVETRGRRRMELTIAPLSPDELDALDDSLDLSAVRRRVDPAILELPPTLRDAVRLRCIDGRNYDEIATHLGVLPATARKRVSRGLRQLGDLLGDNPFERHD